MGGGAVCVEMATDVIMENDNASGTDLGRNNQFLIGGTSPKPFPGKKEAKEASNEDIKLEASNPANFSGENTAGCRDISSQAAELARANQRVSGEVSSACWGSSSPLETLSVEGQCSENTTSQTNNPQNETSSCVSASHVVLEIPEHASSPGIRKITFKFRKKKEDYDTQMDSSVAEHVANRMSGGLCCDEEHKRNYSSWLDSAEEVPEGIDRYWCPPNMELKMSKKVILNDYPTTVKKLLATGILDGARVKYISSSPLRELRGIIDGGGYLCGCSLCNFSKVLNGYEFEQHACSKTRHPNNHIYLENGKPIYNIIQEVKTAPRGMLDEVIKDVAGSSINDECFQVWKDSLQQTKEMVGLGADIKCHSMLPFKSYPLVSYMYQAQAESIRPPFRAFGTYMGTSEKRKRTLNRPRSYESGSAMKQRKIPEGGAKKRYNDLHRLLFMPNGLPDGAELAYYVKGQKILGGYKHGNGIVCTCCHSEISPSQFEAHAGMASKRQPYRHIYTSNGLTLHDIAISLANGQSIMTGGSDDMCTKCGEGGDLRCCESCPQAFHSECLDLQYVPKGPWHCPNCNKLGHGARPIVIWLNRVVRIPENESGGCAICRAHDFDTETFGDRTVIYCDQCEKEFHVGCLRDHAVCNLREVPKNDWFCCDDCNKIHEALQDSVSSGGQMIPMPLLDVINRKCAEKGVCSDEAKIDVQWRMLMGRSRVRADLLSAATAIFRECFDPIVAKSGRDLIPVMVYGRNISGQEFWNMYCVLLIIKDVVVSAGLLRVFGREIAELPLVATCREHQGKGYFQALFSCVERFLYSLNVEKLVLPAAEEAESIWTRKFGFKKMSEGQLSQYTRDYQLTIFNGTSILEKEVLPAIE